MSSYRERLDALVFNERVSLVAKVLFMAICGVTVVGALFLLSVPTATVEVAGIVRAHRTQTTKSSSQQFLIVQLDDGITVEASVPGLAGYKPGRRVVLNEKRTMFFGYKRYELKEYVPESQIKESLPF